MPRSETRAHKSRYRAKRIIFSAPVQDRGRTGPGKKQVQNKWVILYYFIPGPRPGQDLGT